MTEDGVVQIILAMIAGFVALGIAVIPAYFKLKEKLRSVGEDSAVAREQLENNHSTNMREEGDERHDEIRYLLDGVFGKIKSISESQEDIQKDVKGLRDSVGMLHGADRNLRRDMQLHQEISDTVTKQVGENSRAISEIQPVVRRFVNLERQNRQEEGE